ncbi:MAG TPA: 2-amino-4-hydroxy-6-hydroxymethyldihydropteridine diphosphokinase [Candidatus Avidesulfovibrio excrementigallinarum]|nr:2-amino-4-hydroxy-6-hydroxymethyldihydropteridine diphosphokinase [Candidatus Avidesulfovibrio excrementigallinarum]
MQDAISAFVCLGSNQGVPEQHLEAARSALAARGLSIVGVSPVYLTEPQGYRDQPWFANQVLRLACPSTLSPMALLDLLLEEETRLGRVRSSDPALRFGPRVIDMDLLLFGNVVMETPRLILPHPRMAERAFVLVPLADLAPDLVLPDGRCPASLLAQLSYSVTANRIHQS